MRTFRVANGAGAVLFGAIEEGGARILQQEIDQFRVLS